MPPGQVGSPARLRPRAVCGAARRRLLMPLDDEDEADWIDEPDDEHADDGTTPCPACGVDMYEDSPRCP
jgi:hypothetical protein